MNLVSSVACIVFQESTAVAILVLCYILGRVHGRPIRFR